MHTHLLSFQSQGIHVICCATIVMLRLDCVNTFVDPWNPPCVRRQIPRRRALKTRGSRGRLQGPRALPPFRIETLGTNAGTSPPTPHSTLSSAFAAIGVP